MFAWRNWVKHKKPQDFWSLDQDLNPGPSRYKALYCKPLTVTTVYLSALVIVYHVIKGGKRMYHGLLVVL